MARGASALRLYRGLTRGYDPTGVDPDRLSGTDFTDCPFTALRYAAGRGGVLLVVDVPEGDAPVSEELWMDSGARRFMLWGAFDSFIVAVIPAKELRAELRCAGVAALPDDAKADLLRRRIAQCLDSAAQSEAL